MPVRSTAEEKDILPDVNLPRLIAEQHQDRAGIGPYLRNEVAPISAASVPYLRISCFGYVGTVLLNQAPLASTSFKGPRTPRSAGGRREPGLRVGPRGYEACAHRIVSALTDLTPSFHLASGSTPDVSVASRSTRNGVAIQ